MVAGTVTAVATWFASLGLESSLALLERHAYGGIALAAIAEDCSVIYRLVRTRHRTCAALAALLWMEASTAGLLSSIVVVHHFFGVNAVVVVGGFVAIIGHAAVQQKISGLLRDHGLLSRTEHVKREPFVRWIFGLDEDGQPPDRSKQAVSTRLMVKLLETRAGLSAYAIFVSFVLVLSFSAEAVVAWDGPVVTEHSGPPDLQQEAKTGTAQPRPEKSQRVRTREVEPAALTLEGLLWAVVCGPTPGADGPKWAKPQLYELYLGPGGPGFGGGGCTDASKSISGSEDSFVYVVGRTGADITSVGVASRAPVDFDDAVYFAPAAQIVLHLIAEEGPIGGPPRFPLRNGDGYLVYSHTGTWVLVRAQTVLSTDPHLAEPYHVLPPSVADEWFADMVIRDEWLWPRAAGANPTTGRTRYEFRRGAIDGRVVATVEYDPTSGRSFVDVAGQLVVHVPDGRRLPIDDVKDLSRK